MNTMYEYVVLRLAPDAMRGEVVNVGAAVFGPSGSLDVRWLAPMGKIKALGLDWDTARAGKWIARVRELCSLSSDVSLRVAHLASNGLCEPGEPGMFHAETSEAYAIEVADIRDTYVRPGNHAERGNRERRPRLVTELRKRFEKMQLMGKSVDDIQAHLVVANVPVPGNPDLKADFVYKNGVYRITQTLDYRVSAAGAHQKVQEACTKSVAADIAVKAWGPGSKKYAVVQVPANLADIADSHLDMLHAQGFDIFHADVPSDMARYHHEALPGAGSQQQLPAS